jgi:diguanylate cyclase (GGDEF)-like protein
MLAIAAFAVGSDLMSVQSDSSKIKFSGMALATVLVAVRYGGAPAALIGMLTIAVGWFRWREASHYLRNNLATYAWFPLASGLFFGAVTRLAHLSSHDAAYYALVLPTFGVTLLVSFVGVFGYQCYLDRTPFSEKLHEALIPILAAELFSAVLTTMAVYFVVENGTIGIVVLLVTLAIFQYLLRELLTSQRRAEELHRRGEELHRRATTDELTGLANRERFHAAVEEQLAAARAGGPPFAVMLIDLDHFKEVNDTLGHHYGDVVLRDLGSRLVECMDGDAIVARLGGDEFGVVPSERTVDPEALGRIALSVIERVEQPIVVDEMTLEVGASIGIARAPIDGEDAHALLRCADVAMYAAKEQRTTHAIYRAKLDRHSRRRLTVLSDFRRALETDELIIHYQPIVEIDGSRPRAAEGLVRWQHPELGLVPPDDFIPIAEQSGLIVPLTRHVLERAIAQCMQWHRAGHELTVSVNLSVRDLLDRDLPRHVERMLDSHGLCAEALELEITESMIMSEPDRAAQTVRRLCDLGVRVAVDDFGTGYSSLANLRQLPLTELKIDRTFVGSLLRNDSDLIIVRSTINLGHDLGLKVIAEGVEDELTLKRLATLGCDLAQGYHLSRPLGADAFTRWIDLRRVPEPEAAAPSRTALPDPPQPATRRPRAASA